jgi:hypothetical protein
VSRRRSPGAHHRGHNPWFFPLENNSEIRKNDGSFTVRSYHYCELFFKPFPV